MRSVFLFSEFLQFVDVRVRELFKDFLDMKPRTEEIYYNRTIE